MNATTSSPPLRILQISDPHLYAQRDGKLLNVNTDSSFCGVIRHILQYQRGVDAVLVTGDISQDGSAEAYQRFIDLAAPLAPVMRGLPGNHDANATFYSVWKAYAERVTDMGQWRLVLLDSTIHASNAGHLASDELALLHDAITTAGERHVLVAVHHNPVPIGSLWLDRMMIDNGHELLAMLATFPNVRGLIWGHVHQEFDTAYNFGTRQLRLLATPATCVQFTPRSVGFSLDSVDPGYRWLELHEDGRIDTAVVRVPGLGIKPDMGSAGY